MKNRLLTILLPLIGLLLFTSLYTVHETEQVIVVQFGKPIGDIISDAGLKFKLPFSGWYIFYLSGQLPHFDLQ